MAHSGTSWPHERCIMFLHVQDPGGGNLVSNGTNATHPHAVTELCDEGGRLYATALRTGRVSRGDAESIPCLLEFALLHPDPDDANWMLPVPPSVALAQRLNPLEHEITERRRLSIELADSFEPFMALSAQQMAAGALDHGSGGARPDQRRARPGDVPVPVRGAHRPAEPRPPPRQSAHRGAGARPDSHRPGRPDPDAVPARRPVQPRAAGLHGTVRRREGGVPHDRRAGGAAHHLRRDRGLHTRPGRPAGRAGAPAPGTGQLPDQGLRVHVEPGGPAEPALPTRPRRTASPTSSTPLPSSSSRGTWTRRSPGGWA